jgi:RimJ/RimL family protein N-acetyltransferase
VVEYAFSELELPHLVAIVDASNLASIRIMEKLGMHHLGRRNAHELESRHSDIEVEMYALDNDRQL